ncbi:MAG TPA: PDZ domain-containing protein [Candidatus Binatus sp.]|nr:PDZ domain-containing protein [Candidatus Binatus sp.]
MRRYVMTSIAILPLLLTFSHAAQKWAGPDSPAQSWVFASEDTGTSSYLGVDISDITTERLSALKLKEEKGVEVTMVDQDAPAGKAGIKEHDVILTMNGTSIESGAQLRRMIHEMPPGRVVSFGLSRDGAPMTVKVQLADKHNEFARGLHPGDIHVKIPDIHIPDIEMPNFEWVVTTRSERSGLMVENITPQLGEFFGVKNGNGVLVRSVEKGSTAEKAGLRAGDVIVKVNDQAVHDTSDFTHAVRSRNGGSVSIGVMREKKEQNINLTLPERKESGELLEEESLDGPVIDAEAADELSELGEEVAKLQPQMELAVEDAQTSVRELRKDLSQDVREELQKNLCDQQKKMRQDVEKLKNQSQAQQNQLKRDQDRLKMKMDRMRTELRGHSFDI